LAAWDTQVDGLARQVYTSLRQLEQTPAVVAAGAEKLRLEGLQELALEQTAAAVSMSRPVSTIRRGEPALSPRQRGQQSNQTPGLRGSGARGGGGGLLNRKDQ
jgi:hypothetical protein